MNPFSRADDDLIRTASIERAARLLRWTHAEVARRKSVLTGEPAHARMAGWRDRLPKKSKGTLYVLLVIDGYAWLVDLLGRVRAQMRLA